MPTFTEFIQSVMKLFMTDVFFYSTAMVKGGLKNAELFEYMTFWGKQTFQPMTGGSALLKPIWYNVI